MRKWFPAVVLLSLSMLISFQSTVAQDTETGFVYAITKADDTAQIRWFLVNNSLDENVVDVPYFDKYTISPIGTHIAFSEQGTGLVHILDFRDHSLTTLEYYQPVQEFLWDEHYHRSGTLLWAPEGDRLAFTGMLAPWDGRNKTEADVFIYTLETATLENVTQDIPVIQDAITPASWSPDGQWLILLGAWQEHDNEPIGRTGALSRDGQTFLELAPGFMTCRLVWSPDMRWLASETACFEGAAGGSSRLMVIPFNPETLEGSDMRIDEAVSPLFLGWEGSSWIYYYGPPVWVNHHTLITRRRLAPITWGIESIEDEFSSQGLIRFDLSTYSEVLFTGADFEELIPKHRDWFLAQSSDDTIGLIAYNPLLEETLHIPESVQMCPPSYALHIEAQGDYIAVMDACHSRPFAMHVYETTNYETIFSVEMSTDESIRPLGFIER